MLVTPIAGTLGADITGIDVARGLDDTSFQQVHAALVRYGVIVIRDQHLPPQQQLSFVERFGPINLHPHVSGIADFPQIMEVLKTERETTNFGPGWHTDQSFCPCQRWLPVCMRLSCRTRGATRCSPACAMAIGPCRPACKGLREV